MGQIVYLSAKVRLVDPALVVDAALLELLEGVVQPVVEAGSLPALQLPDEDVLEAASMDTFTQQCKIISTRLQEYGISASSCCYSRNRLWGKTGFRVHHCVF